MNKKKVIIIAVILAVLLLGAFIIWKMNAPKPSSGGGGGWQVINITADSLPSQLSQFSAVNEVPQSGVIELYIGDYPYTIQKGKVTSGTPANPDLRLRLPERYLEVFGQKGWCAGLQEANNKGELGIGLEGSKVSLAWKYRALGKYRSCLG